MARLTKQKNKDYQRSLVIGHEADGKPIRKFFRAKTIAEVNALMAEYKSQMAQGITPEDDKLTFAQMGEVWLAQYKPNIGLTARKRYAAVLKNHLNPAIGPVKLRDLKPLHLKGIINALATKGYSEKTIAEIKQTAAQILDAAVENDYLHRNVFAKASIPKTGAEEREPIGQKERDLILSACKGHKMGVPALILLYTGIRKGELLALTWEDVDLEGEWLTVNKAVWFDNNRVSVKTPKSKAGTRMVPIPKRIIPILAQAKAAAKSTLVCPSAQGTIMTHAAYNSAWKGYLHYLNLAAGGRDRSRSNPKVQAMTPFTAHQLRHTYATMLYDAGVDVKSAQKFLGHADLQVTLKIYTHLSEGKELAAVDSINSYLGDGSGA